MNTADPSGIPSPEAGEPPSLPSAVVRFVRNPRARRYVLRVKAGGEVRVTIPRGGAESTAKAFLNSKWDWVRRQLSRPPLAPTSPQVWRPGDLVWYRGQPTPLLRVNAHLQLDDQTIPCGPEPADCRPWVECHLRRVAEEELPPLVFQTAGRLGLSVRRVSVRNQRTRWGSCSRRGTISLNWRLVQTPLLVRDYLIAHELAHLREMNHSPRFWRVVEALFPEWREAEAWLKRHGRELVR